MDASSMAREGELDRFVECYPVFDTITKGRKACVRIVCKCFPGRLRNHHSSNFSRQSLLFDKKVLYSFQPCNHEIPNKVIRNILHTTSGKIALSFQ